MTNENDIMPQEYVEAQVNLKEEAIADGLYDDEVKALSWEDEHALYVAVSTLSELMNKTDSSLSDLIRRSGYVDLKFN